MRKVVQSEVSKSATSARTLVTDSALRADIVQYIVRDVAPSAIRELETRIAQVFLSVSCIIFTDCY